MEDRPNILFIFTDQQAATMMSCAGNEYLRTPAMDSLAASGVRFDRAYCTNPVCVPSRFSLMTGRMPSEIGLRSNSAAHIDAVPPHILKSGLGWLLRAAGYDVAYGGKVHLPKMSPQDIGFDNICQDQRDELAARCADFISRDRDRPFFLVASFVNPHDICYMAIRDFAETDHAKRLVADGRTEIASLDEALRLPEGVSEHEFFDRHCPPLPLNLEPQEGEPEAIRLLQEQRPFKRLAREKYTKAQWRLHRWAYCRLTEMADAQIGRLLDVLRATGQEEKTLVIFSSDHGDMDSAHRMEHKTALYEEACRVPLLVSWPGVTPGGTVNNRSLISNGLDLAPTLCDYAEAEVPADLTGLSFRSLAEGSDPDKWREWVPVESEFGRMIVTSDYKYVLYDNGENREQLIDLGVDPGEMRNASIDPSYRDVLREYRELFASSFGSERADSPDCLQRAERTSGSS